MPVDDHTVLVTGGAGYVGSALVPRLLIHGYRVKVLDLFLFGDDVFDEVKDHSKLECIKGDIRDQNLLRKHLKGCDSVIHLACISNDPSFELNPTLGKSINFDAFEPLVDISIRSGVKRFIYASSSSVYGIKKEQNVSEDLKLEPLTDYSKYKALCEEVLLNKRRPGFSTFIVRPATVCGYAPRLRLDVVVNIFTNHAYHKRCVNIYGGDQLRPNIHVDDMVELYVKVLEAPSEKIDGKIYNAGYYNHSLKDLAGIVKNHVGNDVETVFTSTDDHRSYHISSERIGKEFGFVAKYSIEDAVKSLVDAFQAGKVPDALTDSRYFNIKKMQEVNLH
ncbi:hypothetical protein SCG7109_BR_00020 [Chlamydiales bacterium SCGC AG-110-M15]|nr:hypothetical protein SCG7109_BR_00020 [Chlamydiales bacterium SCGC AG-110-M15]